MVEVEPYLLNNSKSDQTEHHHHCRGCGSEGKSNKTGVAMVVSMEEVMGAAVMEIIMVPKYCEDPFWF